MSLFFFWLYTHYQIEVIGGIFFNLELVDKMRQAAIYGFMNFNCLTFILWNGKFLDLQFLST